MTTNNTIPTCTDCNTIIEIITSNTEYDLALGCDCPHYVEIPTDRFPDSWLV